MKNSRGMATSHASCYAKAPVGKGTWNEDVCPLHLPYQSETKSFETWAVGRQELGGIAINLLNKYLLNREVTSVGFTRRGSVHTPGGVDWSMSGS